MARWLFLTVLLGLITSCSTGGPSPRQYIDSLSAPQSDVASTPAGKHFGDWTLHGLSPGEQRFSPLSQINEENVKDLGLAFEFDDFIDRGRAHKGLEATPLMEDGVLYFTGSWSVVYAVDAQTGEKKWVYDPQVDGSIGRVLCCGAVNRGLALKGDTLFVATLDGYLIALNKYNGNVIWKVDTFISRNSAYSITGAPRLTDKLVVIGNGGAEKGVRGYITAYDMESGKKAWRFFTVPGKGPDENVDVSRARATWSEDMPWEYGGGGTAWDSMVFDRQLNILYVGVGNGSPWPVWERGGGDNLYLSSIVALDATSGKLKWYYQTTPGDSWDYTATQHMILADIEWNGVQRKVLMQAPKNGFFYVLDRESGELLSAKPFASMNWATHVDMKSGRPVLTDNANYSKQAKLIQPFAGGAHNWPPMAFNPNTGLVYLPVVEMGLVYAPASKEEKYLSRSQNVRAELRFPDPNIDADILKQHSSMEFYSQVIAWDPIAAEVRWRSERQIMSAGGILATNGNIVVSGTVTGHLNFYDAKTGELLNSIATGTAIMAPPISFQIGKEQYIAVLAGFGGANSATYMPGSAPARYQNSQRLLVYKLGGGITPLPPPLEKEELHPVEQGLPGDQLTISKGGQLYHRHCRSCHISGNRPGGYPSLWNMPKFVTDNFDRIVLDGAYSHYGMASFSDLLDHDDTIAIRAFIANDRALAEHADAALQ